MVLSFGQFELDVAACELRREGRSVPLQPRVFDTLRYLIEHRDRLVAKQELIDALWGGQQLNAVAVPWSISHARKALGQRGSEERFIETVRGRGYRFVAEVREWSNQRAGSDAPAPITPVPRFDDPFVGREQVMLQLTAALEAARGGRGGLLLLSGEAGIGKTRCASEFAALVRARGLSVWSGRCVDGSAAPAFWPLIQVLRDAAADMSLVDPDRSEAERLLHQLVPHAGDAAPANSGDAETDDARFWLLDRLSRFLARCARARVRVVTLDDLQTADESSLRALALLAPLLERTQLLVIGTARDTPADPERGAGHLSMRLRPCERVALAGLSVEDVENYLQVMLGEPPTQELSRAVHARTAGNPLFVREAVRIVRAQHQRDGQVRAEEVQLPEAAKGFLSDRLAALDPQTRVMLDAASVIGEEFELPVLQRTTELSTDEILAGLQAAGALRIVEPKPDGLKHGFVHPLMREVLYAALSTSQRAHLHAQVALALEALALVEPRLNQLAYHFHHAPGSDHYERAVRYARLAGDAAMRVYAYDEAAQFYAWALEAQPYLKNPDTRAACELLLASAAALVRSGRRHEFRKQCKQAIALARQAGLAEILVQAARLLRPSVTSAVVPDALVTTALEEALALLPESEVGARALAYSRLACIPPYASTLERSRQLSDEAMRLAHASGDRFMLLEALRSRFRSLSGPDSMEELLRVAEEILAADPQSVSWWSCDALIVKYQTLLRRGDLVSADRALAEFGGMARAQRSRELVWHHDRLLAQRALAAGRLDEAERQFNDLFSEGQRLHLPYGPLLYGASLNALSVERTGRRLGPGVSQPAGNLKWAQDIPTYRTERILLSIQYNERENAQREFLSVAADGFKALTRDSNFLFAAVRLALAAVALEERSAAAELYAILQPYASLIALSDFSFSLGSVSYYLGVLARFLGMRAEARAHFERAIESNQSSDNPLHCLRSRLALAELLAENASRADRAQALALASEVRAAAQRYGTNAVRAQAVAVAERLSAAGSARLNRAALSRARTRSTAPRKRVRLR
ncbi:MAG TPA: AAA family ATPase [Polyangiales bacterium]|nr:AAA family ATPase [Polyangiales bacterium]